MSRGIGRYKKVTKEAIHDYNKVVNEEEKLDPKNKKRVEELIKLYDSVLLGEPLLDNRECEMCGEKYNGKFFKYVGYFGSRNMTICRPCASKELFGTKYTSHRIYLFLKSMGVL